MVESITHHMIRAVSPPIDLQIEEGLEMLRKSLIILLVLSIAVTALVSAQEILPHPDDEVNPDANISYPPPVYVLRGEVDLRGTANIQGMTSFFVEFRPLELPPLEDAETTTDDTEEESVEEPWFPAILPSTNPVIEDVLGTWNTFTAPDGLYEMRLVVNVTGGEPIYAPLSPIRIENDVPDFVEISSPVPQASATATPISRPTLAPSPTAVDTTPQVTARLDANVREGDNTVYDVVGVLREGQTARIVGISTSGNGWYNIELANGTRGWIAPSVVIVSGDLRGIPRVDPPFTPTPPATNTPVPAGNLTGSAPDLTPDTPTCNTSFNVLANITNTGTTSTTANTQVIIRDVHVASGQVQVSISRDLPILAPGANFVVGGDLNVSTFYNEEHRIEVIIDPGNLVNETIESDNVLITTYTLAQGAC